MENDTTKTGLVGFFDILGYQNLLERNEPEKIAEDVLPILTNIGQRVVNNLKMSYQLFFSEDETKQVYKIIEEISWLVFSDTVLLTLPIEGKDPSDVEFSWGIFLIAAIEVQEELFDAGLPSRGVIEYGKFFIKDTCFAGRPIVNAYQLCSQLELSACVFSESAAQKFHKISIKRFIDMFTVEYLVPTKKGEKHLLTLKAHINKKDAPSIHDGVMRAFWGNRKDVSISARQKAQNTEQLFEFIEYQCERLAKEIIIKLSQKPKADC